MQQFSNCFELLIDRPKGTSWSLSGKSWSAAESSLPTPKLGWEGPGTSWPDFAQVWKIQPFFWRALASGCGFFGINAGGVPGMTVLPPEVSGALFLAIPNRRNIRRPHLSLHARRLCP